MRLIDPTTALTLALLHWKDADVLTLPERAKRLAAAGTDYLAAEEKGEVPGRDRRRYTNQLAYAAQACGQATRPHERDEALGPITEIETLAMAELRAERDALKAQPVAAEPLDPERYDVKQGLVG